MDLQRCQQARIEEEAGGLKQLNLGLEDKLYTKLAPLSGGRGQH